jgi:hypothetical protein
MRHRPELLTSCHYQATPPGTAPPLAEAADSFHAAVLLQNPFSAEYDSIVIDRVVGGLSPHFQPP